MTAPAGPDAVACPDALRRVAAALGAGSATGALDEPDMLALLALAVAFFGERYERGEAVSAMRPPPIDAPTTAAMVTASAILKGCEVELFELGMWQTFGERR